MRLTTMTDYAMRLLMYVGQKPERLCTIAEVAGAGIMSGALQSLMQYLDRYTLADLLPPSTQIETTYTPRPPSGGPHRQIPVALG